MRGHARLVAGVAILLALIGLGGYRWVDHPGSGSGNEVRVAVVPGATAADIAGALADQDVVPSALQFRLYLRLRGLDAEVDLKAGSYRLRENMSFDQLLARLRAGPEQEFVKLTLPEGFTVEQVASRVGAETHISREDFMRAANLSTVRPPFVPPAAIRSKLLTGPLEGFLYPNTYFVGPGETASSLVERLVRQFEEETNALPWSKAVRLSRYQVLIIASLIEEEAKVDEERREIAAVILNRLRLGMRLEIDATVQFALRKYGGRELTGADLAVDSPYNTRRFGGLPPGPISNPRSGSISAALQPAGTDALYYVLTSDCRHHEFTADYAAFLRAKARAPRAC